MRYYVLILSIRGTTTYRKYRDFDTAESARANAIAMGFDTRLKVVDDNEILNFFLMFRFCRI